MRTVLRALIVLTALSSAAAAADKPNFSGDWKMNASKSNFGALPAPSSIVRKVTHADPSLVIVEDQQSDLGAQNTTRKYTTDGKETSFEANGAVVTGSAVWESAAIVVNSKVDAVGLQFVDRMTLSDDRKTMTSAVHISSAQGDVDLIIVFDRQ